MLIIAITGGIACGKSYCTDFLKRQGLTVIDADKISHEITAPGGAAIPKIRAEFGDKAINADGSMNRKYIADIVFNDSQKLETLNKLLHPLIYDILLDTAKAFALQGKTIIMMDIPLLYETDMQNIADRVICCACSQNKQLERLMLRDNISKDQALMRIGAQLPICDKIRNADYVIDTNGTFEQTDANIMHILKNISEEFTL